MTKQRPAPETDEETWERRWIKAIKTIAEREEQIDELRKELRIRDDAENDASEKMHEITKQLKMQRDELKAQVERLLSKGA